MEVKVNITKIIDDSSYPTFVEFELVDIHGKHHLFRDKLPIISFENEIEPPCEGELQCKVIKKSGDVITIDTSVPWDVDSVEGETIFEVSAELVFEWKDIKVDGDLGSEGGLVINDEEYKDSCRITLEKLPDRYAITCGIYGAFCHTAYCRLSDDKYQQYQRMKRDLREFIDRETTVEEELRFYDEFAKKY